LGKWKLLGLRDRWISASKTGIKPCCNVNLERLKRRYYLLMLSIEFTLAAIIPQPGIPLFGDK